MPMVRILISITIPLLSNRFPSRDACPSLSTQVNDEGRTTRNGSSQSLRHGCAMGLFSLKWWRYTGEMRTFPLMVNVMSTPWFPPGRTECRECKKTRGEGECTASHFLDTRNGRLLYAIRP